MNAAAATLARAAADAAEATAEQAGTPRPRWVAGSLGPTNRTASISPDVNDPAARNVTFDELAEAYGEAARGICLMREDLEVLWGERRVNPMRTDAAEVPVVERAAG